MQPNWIIDEKTHGTRTFYLLLIVIKLHKSCRKHEYVFVKTIVSLPRKQHLVLPGVDPRPRRVSAALKAT